MPSRRFRIAIDARMVGAIPHGFARYVSTLAQSLSQLEKNLPQGLAYEPVFLVNSDFQGSNFYGLRVQRVRAAFLSVSELWEVPKALKAIGADLYHSPSFSSFLKLSCPHIVTVHDLNHLHYGSLNKKIYYRVLLKSFIRKAVSRITVSEFSKKEIAVWAGVPEDSFEVVYNAYDESWSVPCDPNTVQNVLKTKGLEVRKYFYCVSNSKPHKNVALLVAAYSLWRKAVSDPWPLVLTLREYAEIEGVRALGGVGHDEGRALLQGAGGFIFPSVYEGFGLPPVEAAFSGVPLAVSDIAPHHEGLVDLNASEVEWVEPADLDAWVKAFEKLYRGEIRATSSDQRARILERFSARKMGTHMDQIYRDVLGLKA